MRAGRFEFTDGSEVKPKDPTLASLKNDRIGQRLLGTFGFSDVMRTMDGLHYVYSNGPWNLTAVSAIPDRGVFQVDGEDRGALVSNRVAVARPMPESAPVTTATCR